MFMEKKKWLVTFSGRRAGALGIWQWFTITVEAEDNRDKIIIACYEAGYEHIGCVTIKEIKD
jgi:hypothetical protein